MRWGLCCALAIVGELLWLVGAKKSSVLELKTADFEHTVSSSPLILVKFYAPWCGHCKKLKPEYDLAARALEGRVVLAQVDATTETTLAEKWKVDGFPTLFFFKDGRPMEYSGGRTNASIVSWVLENSGPALVVLASEAALEAALAKREALPYFVARGDEALRELFGKIADARRASGSFFFLSSPGEAIVQVHRGPDEVLELLGADTADAERVARFVTDEAIAPFGEINENNFAQYLARAQEGIIWVCFQPDSFREHAHSYAAEFRDLAAMFTQFPVVYTDTVLYEDHVREELGCTDFPMLVLQLGNMTEEEPETESRRYKHRISLGTEPLVQTVAPWIRRVLAGEVEEDGGVDELDQVDEEDADAEAEEAEGEPPGQQEPRKEL